MKTSYKPEEQLQMEHYNKAYVDEYEKQSFDKWSHEYRVRFINTIMLRGLDIRGKEMLEAMGGSMTEQLLSSGARVTCLDISPEMLGLFQRNFPQCRAVNSSVLASGFDRDQFDIVIIVGGLHHLHPYLAQGFEEIHRILKPGGFFCFMEPHTASIANFSRRVWYKLDPMFARNEGAIDFDHVVSLTSSQFELVSTRYGGGPAFILVFNSQTLRMPRWLKSLYAPFLILVEQWLQPFFGKHLSLFVVGQFRKKR